MSKRLETLDKTQSFYAPVPPFLFGLKHVGVALFLPLFLCPAFCTYSTPSTVALLLPGQGVAHGCVRIPRGCDCCILYKICLTLQGPASQRCKQDGVNHRYQDNHHWMKYGQKMILITIGTAGKNDNHPPPPEILVTSRCSRDDSCLLLRPEWRLFLSTRRWPTVATDTMAACCGCDIPQTAATLLLPHCFTKAAQEDWKMKDKQMAFKPTKHTPETLLLKKQKSGVRT